ncbi:MAG: vitamin K epoxide reductase family protein [Candidatus Spechtbacterales bacterium]
MGIGLHIQKNIFFYLSLVAVGFGGFIFPILRPETEGFYGFILAASLAGFGVASYIFYTKKTHKQLVCPTGSNCNAVITSKYSVFLGIPIEYLGMAYYATILASYAAFLLTPGFLGQPIPFLIILLSFGAFLFSIYLLIAQGFLLKQWCIWCLLSATLSVAIFIVSLISMPIAVAVFEQIYTALSTLHLVGFLLGIGSATIATLMFTRFLRDFIISPREMGILKSISELSWLGLATIFMSELAMYLTNAQAIATSEVFWVKTLALFVVALAGAVLMVVLTPYLITLPFAQGEKPSFFTKVRKLIFVTGSVALSSWYFAFGVSFVPEYSFAVLLAGYSAYLLAAISIGLVLEKILLGTKEEVAAAISQEE